MNIEEFKKKNQPKKTSILKKYEVEILKLHNDNFSLKSITKFLSENGVNTTFQNVAKFLKNSDINYSPKPNESSQTKDIPTVQSRKIKPIFKPLEKKGKDLEFKGVPDWAQ